LVVVSLSEMVRRVRPWRREVKTRAEARKSGAISMSNELDVVDEEERGPRWWFVHAEEMIEARLDDSWMR